MTDRQRVASPGVKRVRSSRGPRAKEDDMYTYKDGLCSGNRRPHLYLAKGSDVVKFEGEGIPGVCAIATSSFQKRGKWSNTTYQLHLAPGVRPLYFLSPLHGTWGDHLASWGEVAETLGLPVDVAQRIIRREYKFTAERLDKLEEFSLAVEAHANEAETVVISFGSPTNRAIREGYWEKPKSSQASDGRIVTVIPGPMPADEADRRAREWGEKCGYGANADEVVKFRKELATRSSWDYPTIVEPEGAKIIASRHQPGMHGGYWTIEVAVPISS